MATKTPPDAYSFCWLVGAALPGNASCVCRYLFEKGSHCLKPQLKSSLLSGQLYAAACANIFQTNKQPWSTFSAILQNLVYRGCGDYPNLNLTCAALESSRKKQEFNQSDHISLISCIMQAALGRLALPADVEVEIRNIILENQEIASSIDLGSVDMESDPESPQYSASYFRILSLWLKSVALAVIQRILKERNLTNVNAANLTNRMCLITLLASAAYHYRARLENLPLEGSVKFCVEAPCLDALLSDLGTVQPITDDFGKALTNDDTANTTNLFALLNAVVGTTKQSHQPKLKSVSATSTSSTFHCKQCLVSAALCVLPRLVGKIFDDFTLPGLCSVVALFQCFTGAPLRPITISQACKPTESIGDPSISTNLPPSTDNFDQSAARTNVFLKSIVKNSGGFAPRARPAHPDNQPIAVVDLATVEQLVSSSTETCKSFTESLNNEEGVELNEACEQDQQGALLNEIACNAALAAVGASGASDVCIQVPTSTTKNTPTASTSSINMQAFYLNKDQQLSPAKQTTNVSEGFQRSQIYSTFKVASPSKTLKSSYCLPKPEKSIFSYKESNQPSVSSAGNAGPERASPVQEVVVSTTQSPVVSPTLKNPTQMQNDQQSPRRQWLQSSGTPKKTWSEANTCRTRDIKSRPSTSTQNQDVRPSSITGLENISLNSSVTSPVETNGVSSRSQVAALRLSLDQRRRSIEASRHRALRSGDKVAADKHQAAFLALLHSTQKRRRQGDQKEDCSLSEDVDEESMAVSQTVTSPLVTSQDDILVNQTDVVGNLPNEQISGDLENAVDKEVGLTTDMEDFSSVCMPETAEKQYACNDTLSSGEIEAESRQRRSPRSPTISPNTCEQRNIPAKDRHRTSHNHVRKTRTISPPPSSSTSTMSSESPDDHLPPPHPFWSRSKRSSSRSTVHSCHSNCVHNHDNDLAYCRQDHWNGHGHHHDPYAASLPRRRSQRRGEFECCSSEYGKSLPSYDVLPPQPTKSSRRPHLRTSKSLRICRSQHGLRHDLSPEKEEFDDFSSVASYQSECRNGSHHRQSSRHKLAPLDSGEEYSYPLKPHRPNEISLNRLGFSAGTGLDQLAIEELTRSVTNLKSDIERLTMQHASLQQQHAELTSSRTSLAHHDDDQSFPPPHIPHGSHRRLQSAHSHSRLHLASTPTMNHRATWKTRTPMRYPSECDIRSAEQDLPQNGAKPDEVDDPDDDIPVGVSPESARIQSPTHISRLPVESSTPILQSPEPGDGVQGEEEEEEKSTESIEVVSSKVHEQLFIAFEDPQSTRLQKARERLEARRAADRLQSAEKNFQARQALREAKFIDDVTTRERKAIQSERRENLLRVYLAKKEAESPFPVHTTVEADQGIPPKGRSTTSNAKGRRSTVGAPNSLTHTPRSTVPKPRSAGSVSNSQGSNQTKTQTQPAGSSRVSSTNPSGRHEGTGSGGGGGNDSSEASDRGCRQRSSSRQSSGRMASGQSLSSLHRLKNGDESPYSGPGVSVAGMPTTTRLFVKPKSKSNRLVIVNAISHCCLAGTVNEPTRKVTLRELAGRDGSHFIVLFRDSRCQYRAVYAFDFDSEDLHLVSGNGPRKVTHNMVDTFFKYNSGAKQFSEITSTKHLSAVVDGITIQNSFWLRSAAPHSHALPSEVASSN